MKLFHATLVSAFALSLGACSINVEDGGAYRSHNNNGDYVSVKLPNGERARLRCPDYMQSFVIPSDDDGLIYGCRTDNVPVPKGS